MKYPIDERLHKLARLNQPVNRLYFLAANAVLHPFIRTLKGKGLSHRYIKFKTEYGKVRIHLIRPENTEGALPCMVYFHGGAFMRYAAPHHYRLMKIYALEGNIAVAFVDFYLAPKYKSNRIEGQCLSAYEYLWTHSDALCLDAKRFMTGGDSSGGFLAIKTIKLLKERNIPAPVCNMLIYPLIYGLEDTRSVKEYTDTPVWNSTVLPKMWKYFKDDDYVWVTADEVNIPTYMEIAEFDCLHDADLRFCEELRKAGAEVEEVMTHATIHGYDAVGYEVTQNCLEKRIKFIIRHTIAPDICRI